jgi:hypothetical protein
MFQFFSFATKGSKKYYFNWEDRKALLLSNPENYNPDSYTSICKRFGVDEDKVNKYEYNPLTKQFSVYQTNIKNDFASAKKWVEELDFKKVIEPLIIKPIINPFHLIPKLVQTHHIELLKQWIIIRDLIRDSIRISVVSSFKNSVKNSVKNSIRDSVGDSFKTSVWDSVRISVGDSVGISVGDSVLAYISSFYNLEKWKYIDHEPFINPFQPCIDLWNDGFVPSFDGKTWRLHSGEKADIVYELKI